MPLPTPISADKMNTSSSLDTLIERLQRKCDTLTRNIEFHDTMLNHHQKQMDVVSANIDIRKNLRTKVKNNLEATRERLESLKKAKDSMNKL